MSFMLKLCLTTVLIVFVISFADKYFVNRLLLIIRRELKYKLEAIAVEDTIISIAGDEVHLFGGRIYGLSNLRETDKAEVQLQLPDDYVLNVNLEAINVTFKSNYSMKKSKFTNGVFHVNVGLETIKIKTEILIKNIDKKCEVIRLNVKPIIFVNIEISSNSTQFINDFNKNYPKSIIRAVIDYSMATIINEALNRSCFNKSIRDGSDYDVAVIGAGIAALSAAEYLIQKGVKNVAIFEASNRIGGRIKTDYTPSGPIEIGAEWILSASVTNNIYNLANINGLISNETCKLSYGNGHFIAENGVVISKQLTSKVMSDIILLDDSKECSEQNGTEEEECFNTLFDKLLIENYIKEEDKNIAKQIFNCWKTDHFHQGKPNGMNNENEYKCRIHINGGTAKLIEVLTGKIGKQRIFVDHEVLNVKLRQNNLELTLTHKNITSKVTANYVICTVSLGVLKVRHSSLFTPSLPQKKIDAINRLQFLKGVQITMYYEKPFWRKNEIGILMLGISDENYAKRHNNWLHRISSIYEAPYNRNVLIIKLFANNSEEIELSNDLLIAEKITALIRNYTHDVTIPKPNRIYKSKWCTDRFVRGLYATSGVNSVSDSMKIAEEIPEKGEKRLFFAGEALSVRNIGTMHGARESGLNAAINVIRSMKKK